MDCWHFTVYLCKRIREYLMLWTKLYSLTRLILKQRFFTRLPLRLSSKQSNRLFYKMTNASIFSTSYVWLSYQQKEPYFRKVKSLKDILLFPLKKLFPVNKNLHHLKQLPYRPTTIMTFCIGLAIHLPYQRGQCRMFSAFLINRTTFSMNLLSLF